MISGRHGGLATLRSTKTFDKNCVTGALARGSREPGQDLTVAAISEVLLCEGLCHTVVDLGTTC